MMFYYNFCPAPFFFIFINFEYHVRMSGNLIKLSLRPFFTARRYYLVDATDCFYQLLKYAEIGTQYVVISAFFSSIISYVTQKTFPSLLSNNSHAIHKDQIFHNEIDSKCCLKNLLRFFTNNMARIFK